MRHSLCTRTIAAHIPDITHDQRKVLLAVNNALIQIKLKIPPVGGQLDDLLAPHKTFAAAAVFNKGGDACQLESVLFGKGPQLRQLSIGLPWALRISMSAASANRPASQGPLQPRYRRPAQTHRRPGRPVD